MSKFGTFGAYPRQSLATAEAALLTVWPTLGRYHDHLVLVGGLAVRFLTKNDATRLPGAVTMDVDFGITLAASGGQYGTIRTDLAGLGFTAENDRLVRNAGSIPIYLDFLTDDPPSQSGTRIVDDVVASVTPGVDRALACRRRVTVRGRDLYGVEQECAVFVAGIGPLLVMKLNAFGGPTARRHPKDAYDVLLAVSTFVDGPEAAVRAFHAEGAAGNRGFDAAVATLRRDFRDADQDGPVRAAEFVREYVRDLSQVQQDAATVAKYLLEG
jgi:hypothetical protein